MHRYRFRRAFAVTLALTLVLPIPAAASVWTDQADYAPGSVVTISGDNSNDAGYLAGETVSVHVSGPNGYEATCEDVADESGAWSCQITLWDSYLAEGDYSYTATGLTSGVEESGSFTDHGPSPVTSTNFSITANATFLVTVSVTLGGGSASVTLTAAEANIDGLTGDLALTGPGGNGNGTWSGSFQGTCATTYKINNIKVTWRTDHDHQSTETPGPPQPQVTTDACAPANTPPTVNAGGPYGGAEGEFVSLDGTVTDPDAGDTITSTWSVDSQPAGTECVFGAAGANSVDTTIACSDNGSYTLKLTASDGVNPAVSSTATLTLSNENPSITAWAFPLNPYTGKVNASASFSDPGWTDTHSASFSWGDGTPATAGTTGAGNENAYPDATGTFTAFHQYAPGCYAGAAMVTVEDDDGGSDTATLAAAGTLSIYSVTFRAPLQDGVRNIVRKGNVIPTKLLITDCDGNPVLGKTLSIRYVQGVAYDEEADAPASQIAESVSNADTDGYMREVDSMYFYNLATKSLTAGLPYTIVVRDYATGQIVATALIEAK